MRWRRALGAAHRHRRRLQQRLAGCRLRQPEPAQHLALADAQSAVGERGHHVGEEFDVVVGGKAERYSRIVALGVCPGATNFSILSQVSDHDAEAQRESERVACNFAQETIRLTL